MIFKLPSKHHIVSSHCFIISFTFLAIALLLSTTCNFLPGKRLQIENDDPLLWRSVSGMGHGEQPRAVIPEGVAIKASYDHLQYDEGKINFLKLPSNIVRLQSPPQQQPQPPAPRPSKPPPSPSPSPSLPSLSPSSSSSSSSSLSSSSLLSASSSCDDRRIYMYELPPEFNALILQQCNYQVAPWLNFCPHLLHNGFGKLAVNDSDDEILNWPDWYETDPYMLEVIFHSRMSSYVCRTDDAAQADAFFIPYYSGLDALHYLYGKKKRQRATHGVKLVRWLMQEMGGKYWARRRGHDHFIVMGRTAWDFARALPTTRVTENISMAAEQLKNLTVEKEEDGGEWGTSFANLPAMDNVTALFLEKRLWRWNEQAIPYPTGFHPSSMEHLRRWQNRVLSTERPFLFSFVGAPRTGVPTKLTSLRQAALWRCMENRTACTLLDCSKIKCAHSPIRIAERLLSAEFCLQPPGDSHTRRSTFDGILSGCIPVFFSNDSAYTQYTWHLPGDDTHSYSVFVHPSTVQLAGELQQLLSAIPSEQRRRMRTFIVEQLIPRVIYASSELATADPALNDAFLISLHGFLHQVAEQKKKKGRLEVA